MEICPQHQSMNKPGNECPSCNRARVQEEQTQSKNRQIAYEKKKAEQKANQDKKGKKGQGNGSGWNKGSATNTLKD